MKKVCVFLLLFIFCFALNVSADITIAGTKIVDENKAVLRVEVNEKTSGLGGSKYYEYNLSTSQAGAEYADFIFESIEQVAKKGDLQLVEKLVNGNEATLKFKLSKKFFKGSEGSCRVVLTMVKGDNNTVTDNNNGHHTQPRRDWTIISYWAADNNLDSACEGDIEELLKGKALNPAKVAWVFEIDRETKKSGRYILRNGKLDKLQELPEINTGDPKVLLDFINWAIKEYPAKKYFLELWGHGTGWISLEGPGSIGEKRSLRFDNILPVNENTGETYQDIRKMLANDPTTGVSNSNSGVSSTRSFGYDDSHHDCITLGEFKDILKQVRRKFDIIAFDCCLMNNIEVGYHLKSYTDNLVAAVTTFPGMGFYYTGIVDALADNAGLDGEGLGNAIYYSNKMFYEEIKKYIKENESQIQSNYGMSADEFIEKSFKLNFGLVKLNKLDPVMNKIDELSVALMGNMDKRSIETARARANDYGDMFGEQYGCQYTDLYEFAKYLEKHNSNTNIKKICSELQAAVEEYETVFYYSLGSLKEGHISIYFPAIKGVYDYLDKYYKELDFTKASKWNDFLKKYFQ